YAYCRTQASAVPSTSRVLFVCLHGAAKSVVGAAHFRRLAAERGLAIGAVAAGTEPDAQLAPGAVKGLAGDGLEPALTRPCPLTPRPAASITPPCTSRRDGSTWRTPPTTPST